MTEITLNRWDIDWKVIDKWCHDNIGPGEITIFDLDDPKSQLSESYVWDSYMAINRAIFRFMNEDDALLFTLKWA